MEVSTRLGAGLWRKLCRSTRGCTRLPGSERHVCAAVALWGVDALCDGVAAEPSAGPGAEQRVCGPSGTFGEPVTDDVDHQPGKGNVSVLTAFAFAADVGGVAEGHVGAVEA